MNIMKGNTVKFCSVHVAIVSLPWTETFRTRAQPSYSTCRTSTGRTTLIPPTGDLGIVHENAHENIVFAIH